ncbi:MAG: DUF6438 domain-containing protein, partial [Gemmatimonadaceae bacterium]
ACVSERTPCFGRCPAYRLSVARTGAVRFEGTRGRGAPASTERIERDSIAPAVAARLLDDAERAGVYTLPLRVQDDPTLCGRVATDHPSLYVLVFRGSARTRVDYYLGCNGPVGNTSGKPPALARLEAWAAAVDSAAGVRRWTEPARK